MPCAAPPSLHENETGIFELHRARYLSPSGPRDAIADRFRPCYRRRRTIVGVSLPGRVATPARHPYIATANANQRGAMTSQITIRGAREHNLKDIDVELPRDSLVVITGLSGSGKSSLAFDTIYAEGQRRYVESLSAYARQFLELMQKPDVDSIDGLSPAISIEQKTTSRNPRSTVGTVTEIYDYMRLLWARVGIPYSPA